MATPIWLYDLDRRVRIWANPAALSLFCVPDLDALRARETPMELTDGTRRRLENYRRQFQIGQTVTEEWSFYPEGEPPVRALCTCRGIMLEEPAPRLVMLVEARVIDADPRPELRLLEALRHIQEQISLYTVEGIPLVRNPSAEAELGPPLVDDRDDRFAGSFVHGETAARARKVALTEGVFRDEVLVRTSRGPRWHDLALRRIVDPVSGHDTLLAWQNDVHERHELEESLRELRLRAEAANEAKSEFLAVVSHELRTPMTGILAAAQLLEDGRRDANEREALDTIVTSGRHMVGLIDELLDLGRIEAGHLSVDARPTDISVALHEGLSGLATRAAAEDRTLHLEVASDLPTVLVDRRGLIQIVLNLASNGLKFSTEGPVNVVASLADNGSSQLSVDQAGVEVKPQLVVTVSDQGIGLTEEEQRSAFQAFVQVDASRSRKRGGLGLGLYIAQRWSDAMNGTLTVQSQPGRGSTFQLSVPVEPTEPAAGTESINPLRRRELDIRVLVVDDNALNLRAFRRALRRWNCEVETAENGLEALDRIAGFEPDVVLMDIQMPGLDGAEATCRLRAEPKTRTLPVIALTADAFYRGSRSYEEAGFTDFVLKPVDWERLYELLLRFEAR
ncbi:MAG: response regulator [Myxococcota bacterium]